MTGFNVSDTEQRRRLEQALGPAYELRQVLGRGGFATVHAAFDRSLKRDVAVKLLHPELAGDPAVRERFRREAEAVARVRHPHIIPIYAVGEVEGLAWYVMPLVAGESLRARLERVGRLSVTDARRILLEATSALAAAHGAGIVHRDVKPDNILLDGADARVLVTDFGIAKALAPGPDRLTQTGVAIGTPQYMSPEQASGEPVDQRSDVYALGVVAYQMLTGELPFSAPTVAALLVKQMVEVAPPVTRRRPDCPADLAAAVARCLAKEPAQRWASADHLRRALTEPDTTREERRSARPVAVPEPLLRFRLTVGIALAGVALLAGADLLWHRVLLGPLGFLAAAFVVAARYGTLWTAGYSWRDALRWRTGGAGGTPVPLDSAEFGPHAAIIQQARNDRAAMLVAIERSPKSERRLVAAVIPAVDVAVARLTEMARQRYGLERQIEPGPAELERRLAATRAEAPSRGRDQRLLVLQRRCEAVRGLEERRDRLVAQFDAAVARIGQLRLAVEDVDVRGMAAALERITTATAALDAR
jgi:hypothetical protein